MEAGKVTYTIRADDSKLESDFDEASKKVSDGGNKLKSAAGKAAVAVGAAAIAAGGAALKFGTEFEQSLANTSTLIDTSVTDMDGLKDKLLDLSDSTGVAATELSDALYNALSSGIPATKDMGEAMLYMEQNTKLAKAGFTDINTAVEATAKVLNAYGMDVSETDRVHKVLMQTQNYGIATVGELGSVLAQVTPTAAAFGVSFEQVGASLATMTAQGTPAAQATTQLNSLLAELGKNGTVASENLAKATEGTQYAGMGFQDMVAAGVPLNQILDLMGQYAADNGISMLDLFSSIEGGRAALQISGEASEMFTDNLKEMSTEADVVGEAYDKVTNTSGAGFQKLLENLKNIAIRLFDAMEPIIDAILPVMAQLIEDLLPPLQELMEAVLPVLQELITNLLPPLLNLVEAILPIIVELATELLTPLIRMVSEILPPLIELFKIFIEPLSELLETIIPPLIEILESFIEPLSQILENIIPPLTEAFKLFIEPLMSLIEAVLPPILELLDALIKPLLDLLEKIVPPLTEVFKVLGEVIDAVSPIVKFLAEVFSGVLKTAIEIVSAIIGGLIDAFNAVVKWINEEFVPFWKDVWNGIANFFKGIINGIIAGLEWLVNAAIDAINALIDAAITMSGAIPGASEEVRSVIKLKHVSFGRLKIGLDYVPNDEFPALLHRGEAVLTAEEASTWRSIGRTDGIERLAGQLATNNGYNTAQQYVAALETGDADAMSKMSALLQQQNALLEAINNKELIATVKARGLAIAVAEAQNDMGASVSKVYGNAY